MVTPAQTAPQHVTDSADIFLCYPDNQAILDGEHHIPRPVTPSWQALVVLAFCGILLIGLAVAVQRSIVGPIDQCIQTMSQGLSACFLQLNYLFGSLIGIALFVFLCHFSGAALAELWNNRQFRRGGTIVYGSVCSARAARSRDPDDDGALVLTYRFAPPSRAPIVARVRTAGRAANASVPQPGTPIAVLYVSPRVYRIL